MPRNGSGTYILPESAFVAGTVISSAAVNDDFSDIAIALTGSLARNGEGGMTGQFKAIDGSQTIPSITFENEQNTGICRFSTNAMGFIVNGVLVGSVTPNGVNGQMPKGAILDFPGGVVPPGWLLCYGQNVSRTAFNFLFAVIGTIYGSGDGSTTFGIPDLRGRTVVGKDDMGGVASGRITSTFFGSLPTTLGNPGGAQAIGLTIFNIPQFTPAGSIVGGSINVTDANNYLVNGTAAQTIVNGTLGSGGFGWSNAPSVLHGLSLSGSLTGASFSGTPFGQPSPSGFSVIQPSLILNKIIFWGGG